jgi:hypothetical protein
VHRQWLVHVNSSEWFRGFCSLFFGTQIFKIGEIVIIF